MWRVIVYCASVWISATYAAGYWVVGPVFGLVVVAYDSNLFRNLKLGRHAFFILVSTIIYAAVCRIALGRWERQSDLFNYFIGPFPVAVVVGSILMCFAHRFIFQSSNSQMFRATISLIASFYLVTLFGYLKDKAGLWPHLNLISAFVAVWQGTYLYLFFVKTKGASPPR